MTEVLSMQMLLAITNIINCYNKLDRQDKIIIIGCNKQ